jgi:lysozyme family protein
MTKHFFIAFAHTVGNEGGYVNDPDDRGGETNFGISKRSYPHLDIKNLTISQAQDIYFDDFWNTKIMNLDRFSLEVAQELFDTGVNVGMPTVRKMLQEALNLLNRVETRFDDLEVDGWIGEKSMKAVSLVKERELLKVLNGLQFVHYLEIVKHDHSQERFFAGWVKRT